MHLEQLRTTGCGRLCRSYTNLSRCFQTSPVRSLSVTTN